MAIVTDLDGTLIGTNDEPITPMLNLLLDAHQRGERVIIVSGRQNNRLDETRAWLDEHGLEVADSDIHLSDFPVGPNASESFKIFKAKKLLEDKVDISAWYENDAMTRRRLKSLGVNALDPANVRAVSPTTPGVPVPTSFGVRQTMQAPQAMRDAAHDGLKFYAMGRAGDGLTAQTVREARDMVKGIVTPDKWKRIAAWVARHRQDWEGVAKNSDVKDPAFPGAGAVAAYLWGVDPTDEGSADQVLTWAKKALDDGTEENSMDAVTETRDVGMDVPAAGDAVVYGANAYSLACYVQACDASIDAAQTLLEQIKDSNAVAAQAYALLVAADASLDSVFEALGVSDPDEDVAEASETEPAEPVDAEVEDEVIGVMRSLDVSKMAVLFGKRSA